MKKNYRPYEVIMMVVCSIAILLISCRVDRQGLETVDQHSVDMGYGLCLMDRFLYATTNDGVELFEIGTGDKLRHIQSIDLGAASFTILVQDSISYVGGEGGLTILRLSNDGSFQLMSRCSTAGTFIHKLSLRGDLLYVSDFYKGLSVVDVSDLQNPYGVSHHDFAAGSWDLTIEGDLLYLANTSTGLVVLDITDPAQPSFISVAESSKGARSIVITGDTLYLGTTIDGVKLYDIADRRNPGFIRGVLKSQEIYAFHVEDGKMFCKVPDKGVRIYHMSDSTEPEKIGYFDTGLSHDALVDDSLVYFVGRAIYVLRFVQ